MIWSFSLNSLHLYLLGGFLLAYFLYILRLLIIQQKKTKVQFLNFFKKLFLRSSYFILIIMALMGPSFGDVKKELKSVGKDIYLLIDVSSSMNAYDIAPSRLEKVKKELYQLIKKLNFNDRIGIIVFTEEAFLQCPLTYDTDAVGLYLQTIQANSLPSNGSNFSEAINFTRKKFVENKENKENEDKVIVLASDGEDFFYKEGDAIRDLRKDNILLYTIGIGTKSGSRIPDNPGFKKDKNGNYVNTKLYRKRMESMAALTGGSYVEINNENNEIEHLVETLNNLKGRIKEVKKIELASNKYYYFLALALLLILIDGLLTVNVIKL